MEKQTKAKLGMHVVVFKGSLIRPIGHGSIINPRMPIEIRVGSRRVRTYTPLIKMVRHGKIERITGAECYWMSNSDYQKARDIIRGQHVRPADEGFCGSLT